jgi:hypothetical protein
MTVGAEPTSMHPNFMCVIPLNEGVESISTGGESLPVPVIKQPGRIVIMGDTGCRLSDSHGLYQECNNDSLWPFAQVARSVKAANPDLIIYLGDYIYRESPCPYDDKGCAGSPYGDNQETWEADWLIPAKPVHAAAPLVLIRGNHETCSRAGDGWFRYLDARVQPDACEDSTDPWMVEFNSMQIAVMDVANLEDENDNSLAGLFAGQLTWLDDQLDKPSWISAHRTFWGYGADDDTGKLTTPTEILQAAVAEVGLPEERNLLIGAHIHLAEVLDFGKFRPGKADNAIRFIEIYASSGRGVAEKEFVCSKGWSTILDDGAYTMEVKLNGVTRSYKFKTGAQEADILHLDLKELSREESL